jgi:hypothetical protein
MREKPRNVEVIPMGEADCRYITYANLGDFTVDVVYEGIVFQVNQRDYVLNLVKQHNASIKKLIREHVAELSRKLIRVE